MTSFTGARTVLVVVLAVMLQVSLFARTPVFGAVPDVVLLTAIGVGLAGGPDRGALAAEFGLRPEGVKSALRRVRDALKRCVERRLAVGRGA